MDVDSLFEKIHKASEEELVELVQKSNNYSADQIEKILTFLEKKASPLELNFQVFDCCGTGGDSAETFNISTTAAIIAAANKIKIAKNGGRSSTSKTGSVDVLEALGVKLDLSDSKKLEGLEKFNLGFFSSKVSAELLAPLKQISKKHKISSVISLIGPLTSPVKLEAQVIGVGKKEWLNTMIEICKNYIEKEKRKKIFLVQSQCFEEKQILDELSSASESLIIELDSSGLKEHHFNPQMLDLELSNLNDLKTGENHQEAAKIIEAVLNNSANSAKINTASLNAALVSCLKEDVFSMDNFAREYHNCINLIKNGVVMENFLSFKNFG